MLPERILLDPEPGADEDEDEENPALDPAARRLGALYGEDPEGI